MIRRSVVASLFALAVPCLLFAEEDPFDSPPPPDTAPFPLEPAPYDSGYEPPPPPPDYLRDRDEEPAKNSDSAAGGVPVNPNGEAENENPKKSKKAFFGGKTQVRPSETQAQMEARKFREKKPNLGYELVGAYNAYSSVSNGTKVVFRSLGLSMEWVPDFVQKFGVIGLGVTGNAYVAAPGGVAADDALSFWSIGAVGRYQFCYFESQFLVPYVGYAYENFSYTLVDQRKGGFPIQGPRFGLMLLLNALDRKSTADFYANLGVLRSYLFAEMRTTRGGDKLIGINGRTYYYGVRIEL